MPSSFGQGTILNLQNAHARVIYDACESQSALIEGAIILWNRVFFSESLPG
jgi:hypothetical protein